MSARARSVAALAVAVLAGTVAVLVLTLAHVLARGCPVSAARLAGEVGRAPLTDAWVAVLGALAAAAHVRLVLERRSLRALALLDPLTQVANRRSFDERLAGEVARARRYDAPLALLLVDVDDLKSINDTLGHRGGDLALKAVADGLRLSARATDLVARLGGDELAVLCPSTTALDAGVLAGRVRAAIADLAPTPLRGRLKVSIGIADLDGPEDEGSLVARADAALYEAKRGGRDRATTARHARPLRS